MHMPVREHRAWKHTFVRKVYGVGGAFEDGVDNVHILELWDPVQRL
jgi:hypothetical protein